MDGLDDTQRRAVHQLREIIGAADQDVAISVLNSVDWDVQRAADLIFGNPGTQQPSSSSQAHPVENFDIDDSRQGESDEDDSSRHRLPAPTPAPFALARPFYALLTFPFHVLSSVFRFIFGVLRIPFPPFRFGGLNLYRPLRPRPTTRGGLDRWLRELEEETGAVTIGRSNLAKGSTSSLSVDPGQSSSSSLTSRAPTTNGHTDDGRKYLPDFTISTYEDMLRICQRDAKIGCVILVSDEHDDVAEFKRSTLTNYSFVKTLYDNNIIVWGGDVRDREAWSASEKLQATTYPFVAFLALQPRRHAAGPPSSRSTSPPSLTVLSRHQGKSTPASGPTSASTLVEHLERQLLPRVTPFLNRITATQRERERDRQLREEQDRAFQDAARRDKERIEDKIKNEQIEREARRLAKEKELLDAQRRAQDAEKARQAEMNRMDWRRWTRRMILSDGSLTGNLRIAIRLPNGGRVVQSFSQTASLTSLYAFVDSQFIPATTPSLEDPHTMPNQKGEGESALEEYISKYTGEYWGFSIALAYPRLELPWKPGHKLSDISQLKGGGQVVVEMIRGRPSTAQTSAPSEDDDGYLTEDSE